MRAAICCTRGRQLRLRPDELTVQAHREDVLAHAFVRLVHAVEEICAGAAGVGYQVQARRIALRRHAKHLAAFGIARNPPVSGVCGDFDSADAARVVGADGDAHRSYVEYTA
jgi:hypothetical protein